MARPRPLELWLVASIIVAVALGPATAKSELPKEGDVVILTGKEEGGTCRGWDSLHLQGQGQLVPIALREGCSSKTDSSRWSCR